MAGEKGTIIHFNFTDITERERGREGARERLLAETGEERVRRERSEVSQTRDCALADCSVLW